MSDNPRIDDLRRRVQKDPASIAFAQLGEELRRAGEFDESIDVCHAGLKIHPGYLSARVTLGRALIELNRLPEAEEELAFVLKNAPENLAAIRGLADINHRNGSLADALKHYRAALALARNDPDLQRTVEELERAVEPPKPAASADGLSFEQMQSEFLQHLPPPPQPPPPVIAAPEPAAAPAMDWSASAAAPGAPVVDLLEPAAPSIESSEPLPAPVMDWSAPAVAPAAEQSEPVVAPAIESPEPFSAPVMDWSAPAVALASDQSGPAVAPAIESAEPLPGPAMNWSEPAAAPSPVMDWSGVVAAPAAEWSAPAAAAVMDWSEPAVAAAVDWSQTATPAAESSAPAAAAVMDWSETPAPAIDWPQTTASQEDNTERELAMRTIAALELWLDAIHVTRAQPRP